LEERTSRILKGGGGKSRGEKVETAGGKKKHSKRITDHLALNIQKSGKPARGRQVGGRTGTFQKKCCKAVGGKEGQPQGKKRRAFAARKVTGGGERGPS